MKPSLLEPNSSPARHTDGLDTLINGDRRLQNQYESSSLEDNVSSSSNHNAHFQSRDSIDSFRLPTPVSEPRRYRNEPGNDIEEEDSGFYSDGDLKLDEGMETRWADLSSGPMYQTRLMRLLMFVCATLIHACKTISKPAILAIVPSFLRRSVEARFFSSFSPSRKRFRWIERDRALPSLDVTTSHSKKPTSPTQFPTLDGLRGLSCLMVLHSHWTYALIQSYAYESGPKNTAYVFRLPFLRLLWSGQAQVDVFFVISGYVLSVKTLWLIQQHRYDQVFTGIVSSVFRRAIRIFGPVVCLLLGVFLPMIQLGMYKTPSRIWFDAKKNSTLFPLELHEGTPPVLPSNIYAQPPNFWANLTNILGALLTLFDPTSELKANLGKWKPYDNHLWTMPVEFYCSMQLFMVLLATCRLSRASRLVTHGFLVAFCWFGAHFRSCLFFSGMLAAELDLQRKGQLKVRTSRNDQHADKLKLRREDYHRRNYQLAIQTSCDFAIAHIQGLTRWLVNQSQISGPYLKPIALFASLYILSVPNSHGEETNGFQLIFRTVVPSYMSSEHGHQALRALGAIGVTWTLANVNDNTLNGDLLWNKAEDSLGSFTMRKQSLSVFAAWPATISTILYWIFTNPVMHYLGQISFALYLIHGTVIRSLGYVIMPYLYHGLLGRNRRLELHRLSKMRTQIRSESTKAEKAAVFENVGRLTLGLLSKNTTDAARPQVTSILNSVANASNQVGPHRQQQSSKTAEIGLTTAEYGLIWAMGYLIILPASIWAADVFWRCFDARCVTFGRWVEASLSVKVTTRKTNTSLSFRDAPVNNSTNNNNRAVSLPLVTVQRPSSDTDRKHNEREHLKINGGDLESALDRGKVTEI